MNATTYIGIIIAVILIIIFYISNKRNLIIIPAAVLTYIAITHNAKSSGVGESDGNGEYDCIIYENGKTTYTTCDAKTELMKAKWLHGTNSTVLTFLDPNDPSLLPIMELLFDRHVVPYAGELSAGIEVGGVNVDGLSGTSEVYAIRKNVNYAVGSLGMQEHILSDYSETALREKVETVFATAEQKYANYNNVYDVQSHPSETDLYIKIMRYKQIYDNKNYIAQLRQRYNAIRERMPLYLYLEEIIGTIKLVNSADPEEFWAHIHHPERAAFRNIVVDTSLEAIRDGIINYEDAKVIVDKINAYLSTMVHNGTLNEFLDLIRTKMPSIEKTRVDIEKRMVALNFALSEEPTPVHIADISILTNKYPLIFLSYDKQGQTFPVKTEVIFPGKMLLSRDINTIICPCKNADALISTLRTMDIPGQINIICSDVLFDINSIYQTVWIDEKIFNKNPEDSIKLARSDINAERIRKYKENTFKDRLQCVRNRGLYFDYRCWTFEEIPELKKYVAEKVAKVYANANLTKEDREDEIKFMRNELLDKFGKNVDTSFNWNPPTE